MLPRSQCEETVCPRSSAAIVKMTTQTTKTDSAIKTEIIETLSHTQYACSNIERLNSGNIKSTYISIVDWEAFEYGSQSRNVAYLIATLYRRIVSMILRW